MKCLFNYFQAAVHSSNLGKPAANLSFVGRPEKPKVEEKKEDKKEEERRGEIGWSSEVLRRGERSSTEKGESTKMEPFNGAVSQEVTEVGGNLSLSCADTILSQLASLKSSLLSMQTEFTSQVGTLLASFDLISRDISLLSAASLLV